MGSFYFTDSPRVKQKVNTGLILGFVQFDTPSFPFPGNVDNYTVKDIYPGIIDRIFNFVAWYVDSYDKFDVKMITEIKFYKGDNGVHIIPMEHLLGSVCVLFQLSSLRTG